MIIFDLVCGFDHRFEGWFKNSEEFQSQQMSGLLTCPICDSADVVKIPSATNINFGKEKKPTSPPVDHQHQQMALAKQVNHFIEKNFEDVGAEFSETVKKIHYGEESERNIRGYATAEETKELIDEGIDILPLNLNVKKNQIN